MKIKPNFPKKEIKVTLSLRAKPSVRKMIEEMAKTNKLSMSVVVETCVEAVYHGFEVKQTKVS